MDAIQPGVGEQDLIDDFAEEDVIGEDVGGYQCSMWHLVITSHCREVQLGSFPIIDDRALSTGTNAVATPRAVGRNGIAATGPSTQFGSSTASKTGCHPSHSAKDRLSIRLRARPLFRAVQRVRVYRA